MLEKRDFLFVGVDIHRVKKSFLSKTMQNHQPNFPQFRDPPPIFFNIINEWLWGISNMSPAIPVYPSENQVKIKTLLVLTILTRSVRLLQLELAEVLR